MKFVSFSLSVIILLFTLSSCVNCVEPEGKIKTLNIKLDNFSRIDIEIPANIKIIVGDSAKITISAPESIVSQILTIVKRDRLNLEGNICKVKNNQINIQITTPNLSALKIKGSASVYSETPIKTDELIMKINGSGSIALNVFANSIISDISGTGDININGTCQDLVVDISGSGNFKGLGLNTYKAKVYIEGSGTASVVALNKLNAKVDGSGEVKYSGEPNLDINISGSGKITKIN
jgi:hypothetical protein